MVLKGSSTLRAVFKPVLTARAGSGKKVRAQEKVRAQDAIRVFSVGADDDLVFVRGSRYFYLNGCRA